MVFLMGMAVITILSLGVIVYSLAVIASKTDRLATDTPNKRLDGIVAEQTLVYSSQDKSR